MSVVTANRHAVFGNAIGTDVIQRASSGDEMAISTLYDACYPRIYRFCLARLRDEEQALDASSDVIEKILRALPNYRATGVPFEAWVFRIARNRVIDIVRRKKRTEVSIQDSTPAGTRDEEYDRIIYRDLINQGLARLNRTQRQVITMRFLDGHDVETVAVAIGRSKQATKSIQFRAFAAMRRAILDPNRSPPDVRAEVALAAPVSV